MCKILVVGVVNMSSDGGLYDIHCGLSTECLALVLKLVFGAREWGWRVISMTDYLYSKMLRVW